MDTKKKIITIKFADFVHDFTRSQIKDWKVTNQISN